MGFSGVASAVRVAEKKNRDKICGNSPMEELEYTSLSRDERYKRFDSLLNKACEHFHRMSIPDVWRLHILALRGESSLRDFLLVEKIIKRSK